MIPRITVDKEDGQLILHRWTFWYDDGYHTLYLNSYSEFRRPTTRHKFKDAVSRYARLDTRASSLKVNEVPLPSDVVEDARQQFVAYMKSVKVDRWTRR